MFILVLCFSSMLHVGHLAWAKYPQVGIFVSKYLESVNVKNLCVSLVITSMKMAENLCCREKPFFQALELHQYRHHFKFWK